MDVKIEIVEVKTREHKGTSQAGKAYEIRSQKAYLHNGKHYPAEFDLPISRDANGTWLPPYQPGFYELTPGSITVNGEYHNLEINRYEMALVKVEAPKLAKVS